MSSGWTRLSKRPPLSNDESVEKADFGVEVEEIVFNPGADGDVSAPLPVQYDQSGYPFRPPQWKRDRPRQHPLLYSLARDSTEVRMQVRFSGGPAGMACFLQGTGFVVPHPEGTAGPGPSKSTAPFEVLFNSNGFAIIEVTLENLLPETVYRGELVLEWQVGSDMAAQAANTARVPLYTVLDRPMPPWAREDDEGAIPWQTALDVACDWAFGAVDEDEAVELITRHLNDSPRHLYTPQTEFGTGVFYLSDYIEQLGSDLTTIRVNCRDCSGIVRSLSNLLGVDCREERILDLVTKPITLIGEDQARRTSFGLHQFCMRGPADETGTADDACLKLDGESEAPVAMPLEGSDGYRTRLVERGPATFGPVLSRSVK